MDEGEKGTLEREQEGEGEDKDVNFFFEKGNKEIFISVTCRMGQS